MVGNCTCGDFNDVLRSGGASMELAGGEESRKWRIARTENTRD